jgi:ubiquitin-conjugating enzyme E2 variant
MIDVERTKAAAATATDHEPGRPTWMLALDVSTVGTLVLLLVLGAVQLATALIDGGGWWVLVPALVVAVLCADLVSGVVHWIGDRFFKETTPLLGAMLIHPFREHHRDPLAITRHGFFELCGNNALAVLLPVLLLVIVGPPGPGSASLLWHAFVLFFAVAVFATNQFHKWAHAAQNARPVRWLQASGLILPPAGHARHHRGDFARGYCVTTGWMNVPLDAVRLLPRCETALRRAGQVVRRVAGARASSSSSPS